MKDEKKAKEIIGCIVTITFVFLIMLLFSRYLKGCYATDSPTVNYLSKGIVRFFITLALLMAGITIFSKNK